jgi:hypothetical protein
MESLQLQQKQTRILKSILLGKKLQKKLELMLKEIKIICVSITQLEQKKVQLALWLHRGQRMQRLLTRLLLRKRRLPAELLLRKIFRM